MFWWQKRRNYTRLFARFHKRALKMRARYKRTFGRLKQRTVSQQFLKYAGNLTTQKNVDRFLNLPIYNKLTRALKVTTDNCIQNIQMCGIQSLFYLTTNNYMILSAQGAYLNTSSTHTGMHLSTLYLFCKNFIKLHDIDVYPVLCLVEARNWVNSQTTRLSVDKRRSRTKFLGNLITRGRKETILRAYGDSMMHVWGFTQLKHNFSSIFINTMFTLMRIRHIYFFKLYKFANITALFRLFYLYTIGLQKASDVFEAAACLNTNFVNQKMATYLFSLFYRVHTALKLNMEYSSGALNISSRRNGLQSQGNRAQSYSRTFFFNNVPRYCNFIKGSYHHTQRRVRNYFFFNNLRLNDDIKCSFGVAGAWYTNCDFFYKLIYSNCPIMLYTIKKKDKWKYKHSRRGTSKYTFNLQHLNSDERVYYGLRYARYIYLFNPQRTVRLRMFSYLFKLFMHPERMLINQMGFRATIQARFSTNNYL